MHRLIIIGISSPHGADQLGWHVVNMLKHSSTVKQAGKSVEILNLDRPGVRLLEHLNRVDEVWLVDALCVGGDNGAMLKLAYDDMQSAQPVVSSHEITLLETLSLAKSLDQLPETLWIYGMEIGNELHENIQPDNVAALAEMIERDLEKWMRMNADSHPAIIEKPPLSP